MTPTDDTAPEAGSHALASDPEAPAEAPAEEQAEPAPVQLEPQEYRDRFEKCFQLRGLPIPELTDGELAKFQADGLSPVEAFETATN